MFLQHLFPLTFVPRSFIFLQNWETSCYVLPPRSHHPDPLCHASEQAKTKSPITAPGTVVGKPGDNHREGMRLCYRTQLRFNTPW